MTASIRRTPTTPDRQSVRSNTNFYTFCPGGRNVGTRCCAVKELYQVSRLAAFRQHLEECLEYPGATELPLAAWRPTAQRRHIGLGPGLVDEHQVLRIDAMAIAQPLRTATRDIGAILFTGDQGLFL